jgi:hypothetical protein
LNADDMYVQNNMFSEWQVKYIEYLCMKLIELANKQEQQKVLYSYISLVKNFTRSFWSPDDQSTVTPENLLETAFNEAEVRLKLSNLSDKRKTKLEDRPKTLIDEIIIWFKQDLEKPFIWEE